MRSRHLDLLERTAWTFVQAALAVWIATPADLFGPTTLKVAAVAGLVAAVKCVLAFQVGSGNTAATLPAGPDSDLGGDPGHADAIYLILGALVVLVILIALGAL